MENVFIINKKRIFNLHEAEALLPIIYRLTEDAASEVKYQMNRLKAVVDKNSDLANTIEQEINLIVQKWQQKVEKLGAVPKGMWLADFDKGDGYYCWKYPEIKINHWHGYHDGFSARIMLRTEDVEQI